MRISRGSAVKPRCPAQNKDRPLRWAVFLEAVLNHAFV